MICRTKKVLSLVLVLSLMVSMAIDVKAATGDIDGHWAKQTIEQFVEAGYVKGDGQGNYRPDAPMSRAQFAALINRVGELTEISSMIEKYTDVKESDWYYEDMAKALAAGYMTGTSDTTMSPQTKLTREQAFTMLARLIAVSDKNNHFLGQFSDRTQVSAYATESINGLIREKIVFGNKDLLAPQKILTRAEGIVLVSRIKERIAKATGIADNEVPKAGPKPANNSSSGSTGGGSGSGNSNNGGSGNGGSDNNGSQPSPTNLINQQQTRLMDIGFAQFVVVSFADGYNLDNCVVKVDGVDITAAMSAVDDDKTLAKWEITSLNPGQVEVCSRQDEAKKQVLRLSNNSNPVAPVVHLTPTMAHAVMTHGAVAIWDYHLTNYDANGNVRVRPTKTTFALKSTSTPIKFYTPEAELKPGQGHYGVSGQVTIMFNYSTSTEKAFFDGIAEGNGLALVKYGENQNTLNDSLSYAKEVGQHHGHNVGLLTIPIGQTNFFSNGRYVVRVKSSTQQTVLVPIHVVNEKLPSLILSESSEIVSGKNIHFKVEDMTYAITVPIETVLLKNPAGETKTLEKIRDWYLIGDTFVIYNDVNSENGRNNIPDSGVYQLTIQANGFKTFTKDFEVTDGKARLSRVSVERTRATGFSSLAVDAISSATSIGGGSGGNGGSGGGSVMMSADILFNVDLLANAMIIDKLGLNQTDASAIVNRWKLDMAGWDSVFDERAEKFYKWNNYYDAVQTAKLKGKYLSFTEYSQRPNAVVTMNRPYAVKEVLEDNLLGETQYGGSYKGLTPPTLSLADGATEVMEGNDAILICDNPAYLALELSITIDRNGMPLTSEDYQVKGDQLIIKKHNLELGRNGMVIKAKGYKDNILSIKYAKILENVTLKPVDSYYVGDNVMIDIEGSTGDFLNFLNKVEVNGNQVFSKDQIGGSSNDWYIKSSTGITLMNGLFPTAGEYRISLTSAHYGARIIEVKIAEKEPTGEESKAPMPKAVELVESTIMPNYYSISFKAKDDQVLNYFKNVTKVTVDGRVYQKATGFWNAQRSYQFGNHPTNGGAHVLLKLTADGFNRLANTDIEIVATGYQAAKFAIDKDGKLVISDVGEDQPIDQASPKISDWVEIDYDLDYPNYYRLTLAYPEDDDKTEIEQYMSKITAIKVGTVDYSQSQKFNGTANSFSTTINKGNGKRELIDLVKTGFSTQIDTVVLIKATDYQDLTFTIDKTGKLVESGTADQPMGFNIDKVERVSSYGDDYYRLSFKGIRPEELDQYLNQIRKLTVGERTYEKTTASFWQTKDKYKLSVDSIYGGMNRYLDLTLNGFSETQETTVVIESAGHPTLQLVIDQAGKLISSSLIDNQPEEPEEPELKSAPSIESTTFAKSAFSADVYQVRFEDIDKSQLDQYLQAIDQVTVGGQGYIKPTMWYQSEKAYRLQKEADNYGDYYDFIELTADGFTAAQTEVVIKAKGYQELKWTVEKADSNTEVDDRFSVIDQVKYVSDYYKGDHYVVSFEKPTDADLTTYLRAITKIEINNGLYTRELTKADYIKNKDAYNLTNDPVYDTSKVKFIEISAKSFSADGETTITIHFDGYDNLVFKVTKQGLVQ